jgi:hypothetical protein
MVADESRPELRRSRPVEKKVLPAGPARDLRDAVYQLYAEADRPQLAVLAKRIAANDDLHGAPGKDLIGKIIGGDGLASQQDTVTVAVALAQAARREGITRLAEQVRRLWTAAATTQQSAPLPADRLGRPVGECDPLALEVHPAIQVPGTELAAVLPAYVLRAHDARLREIADEMLGDGRSRLVTLVGGSSTGKTRAGWELAQYLDGRQPGRWRLWHPYDPGRPQAALADLRKAGPDTIVWLNEAQHYLMPAGFDVGEQIAAGLRTLLTDPGRGPVLVLATLWPGYWDTLTARPTDGRPDPYGQVRDLLTGTAVTLTDTFTRTEVAGLAGPDVDTRLRQAAEHAEGGRITQYLAGAPALEDRYRTAVDAMPAARAILQVAIDARRLGHPLALPHALLEQAAPGYLDDHDWDALDDDWLEQALAYTSQPCKGARGPLTRIRPRTGEPPWPDGRPSYRLADYLEQLGRTERAGVYPPDSLWRAFTTTVTDTDLLRNLGVRADQRGRYQHAIWLYRRAADRGDTLALRILVAWQQEAGDPAGAGAPYRQAADQVLSHSLRELAVLGGDPAVAGALYQQAAEHQAADLGNTSALRELAIRREYEGDPAGAEALAMQAADHGDTSALQELAVLRGFAGDLACAEALAVRAADHGDSSALQVLAALRERAGDSADADRARRFGLTGDGEVAAGLDFDGLPGV